MPFIISVKGPVPVVEVNVNCPVPPAHTILAVRLPCGNALTVTVNAVVLPEHPVVVFFTVIVPLYVAAAAPAGTTSGIGVVGNVVRATSTKPAVWAAAS